jgi:signal transduction histidine kinase/CheY-like chemotaxis protein
MPSDQAEKPEPGHRLGLAWKMLGWLSLVLVVMNASLAYLVFSRTTAQFEAAQQARHALQLSGFSVVLDEAFRAMGSFAGFIPLLETGSPASRADDLGVRLGNILGEHGPLLAIEWGFEAVHLFTAGPDPKPRLSWPRGRAAPPVEAMIRDASAGESPRGLIACSPGCAQLVAVPVLEHGSTVGVLLVEQSIADSLKAFHMLSGADIAVLQSGQNGRPGGRWLDGWERSLAGLTHAERVTPVVQALSGRFDLAGLTGQRQRFHHAGRWYEAFAMPPAREFPGLEILVLNDISAEMESIRAATRDSVVVGLVGLLLSELILLAALWGPLRRIREVVEALPLMAEKSYRRLHETLPTAPGAGRLRDEIDVMVAVLHEVAARIESLDQAHAEAETALRESERGLLLAQSLARVARWEGQPFEGGFRVGAGAEHIHPALARVETWKQLLQLVHPEDQVELRKAWRRGRTGGSMDVEFRLVAGRETIDLHAVGVFESRPDGQVQRALGMLQDVSVMRDAERVLKNHRDYLETQVLLRTAELVSARRQAERLAQERGDWLTNVSHELRTPLNAVIGLAQIGMKQTDSRLVSSTFEQILDAGEHLLKLVSDVLDISRLGAGKLVVEREPFELRLMIRQCANMLAPRAAGRALGFHVEIDEALPAALLGDAFRIQQILINLLGNAIKFTERGEIRLHVYRDGTDTCFEVRDSGIGMTQEQLRQLFVPFVQLGDSPAHRQQGAGLGLSISQTLAVLMGGEIGVHSAPGEGSCFSLRLPLTEAAMPADSVPAPEALVPAQRLLGLRILVADDVPVNRRVLQGLLEAEGARVILCSDGAEALEAAGEPGLDVLLLDVMMPRLDGREVARRLRAAGSRVTIIGVTAHVAAEERALSLAAGMDEQLVKPVMRDDLVALLNRLVPAPESAPAQAAELGGKTL